MELDFLFLLIIQVYSLDIILNQEIDFFQDNCQNLNYFEENINIVYFLPPESTTITQQSISITCIRNIKFVHQIQLSLFPINNTMSALNLPDSSLVIAGFDTLYIYNVTFFVKDLSFNTITNFYCENIYIQKVQSISFSVNNQLELNQFNIFYPIILTQNQQRFIIFQASQILLTRIYFFNNKISQAEFDDQSKILIQGSFISIHQISLERCKFENVTLIEFQSQQLTISNFNFIKNTFLSAQLFFIPRILSKLVHKLEKITISQNNFTRVPKLISISSDFQLEFLDISDNSFESQLEITLIYLIQCSFSLSTVTISNNTFQTRNFNIIKLFQTTNAIVNSIMFDHLNRKNTTKQILDFNSLNKNDQDCIENLVSTLNGFPILLLQGNEIQNLQLTDCTITINGVLNLQFINIFNANNLLSIYMASILIQQNEINQNSYTTMSLIYIKSGFKFAEFSDLAFTNISVKQSLWVMKDFDGPSTQFLSTFKFKNIFILSIISSFLIIIDVTLFIIDETKGISLLTFQCLTHSMAYFHKLSIHNIKLVEKIMTSKSKDYLNCDQLLQVTLQQGKIILWVKILLFSFLIIELNDQILIFDPFSIIYFHFAQGSLQLTEIFLNQIEFIMNSQFPNIILIFAYQFSIHSSNFKNNQLQMIDQGGVFNLIIGNIINIDKCFFCNFAASEGQGKIKICIIIFKGEQLLIEMTENQYKNILSTKGGVVYCTMNAADSVFLIMNLSSFQNITSTDFGGLVYIYLQQNNLNAIISLIICENEFSALYSQNGLFIFIKEQFYDKNNPIFCTIFLSNMQLNDQMKINPIECFIYATSVYSIIIDQISLQKFGKLHKFFSFEQLRFAQISNFQFKDVKIYKLSNNPIVLFLIKEYSLDQFKIQFSNFSSIRCFNCTGTFISLFGGEINIYWSLFKEVYLLQITRSEKIQLNLHFSIFQNFDQTEYPNLLGGVIQLKCSNLTVLSSKFLNNIGATKGGVFSYQNDPSIKERFYLSFDNESMFKNNQAKIGAVLYFACPKYYLENQKFAPSQFFNNTSFLSQDFLNDPEIFFVKIYEYQRICPNIYRICVEGQKFALLSTQQFTSLSQPIISNVQNGGTIFLGFLFKNTPFMIKQKQIINDLKQTIWREDCQLFVEQSNITTLISINKIFSENMEINSFNFTVRSNSSSLNTPLKIKSKSCVYFWNLRQKNQEFTMILQFRNCEPGEKNVTGLCIKCLPHEYSNQFNSEICISCPFYGQCKDGNIISIQNYSWRINEQDDNIVYCVNRPMNCQNNPPQTKFYCIKGYVGPLCETCDYEGLVWGSNYFQSDTYQCFACNQIKGNLFLVILKGVVLLLIIFVSVMVNLDGIISSIQVDFLRQTGIQHLGISGLVNLPSIYSKLLLNHIQLISMMSEMDIQVNSINFRMFSDSLGDSISIIASSLDCQLVEINPIEKFIYFRYFWIVFSPVLMIIIQITTYVICSFFSRKIRFTSRDIFFIIMNVYLFLFTSITNSILSHLSCRSIASFNYMKGYLPEKCFNKTHSKLIYYEIIPSCLLYDLYIPIIISLGLKKHSKSLNRFEAAYRFRILYQDYKKSSAQFELVKMIFKITLALIINLNSTNKELARLLTILQFAIYGIIIEQIQPYFQKQLIKIDVLLTLSQICMVVGKGLISLDQEIIYEIMLLFLNILIILLVVLLIVKQYFQLYTELFSLVIHAGNVGDEDEID